MNRHILTIALLVQFITIGFGQLSDSIATITVTASHLPSSIEKTGKSITVITAKDLLHTTATTVDELLNDIPGIHLNTRNGFGVQADIGMRGSTFSQVLLLVDNIRLNDPLTAHFNNNIPVSLAEIGQIEIIRGPSSASFGTDAVGGVIHIKTKSYLRQHEERSLSISGDIGLGAYQQTASNIGLLYQRDKWILSAGAQTNISEGEALVNPNFIQGTSTDSLYQNYFDVRTYSASVAYLFNNHWNIYVRANRTQRDFNAKYFYTQSTYDESTEKTGSDSYQAVIRHHGKRHHSEVNFSYKNTDDLFIFNPLFGVNHHQTTQRILNFSHNINLSSPLKIAFGAQILQQSILSNDRGDHQKTLGGIFATCSYPILEQLHTTASIRLAFDPEFGIKPIPQVNLAYSLKNITFRSSIGAAIRSADFTEQYISSQIPNLSPGRNIGNPNLKPETSFTIDLGIDWSPSPNSQVSSTIFHRQSKNLIDYILTPSSAIKNVSNLQADAQYLYANNILSSKTTGVEFHAHRSYAIRNYWLKIEGNYTLLKTKTPEGITSKYSATHPKHNLTAKLNFQHTFFNLSTSFQYLKRTAAFAEIIGGAVPSNLFLLHAKLSISPEQSKFSFYLQVNNITNTDYQLVLGAPLPKRWWVVGMKWQIMN